MAIDCYINKYNPVTIVFHSAEINGKYYTLDEKTEVTKVTYSKTIRTVSEIRSLPKEELAFLIHYHAVLRKRFNTILTELLTGK